MNVAVFASAFWPSLGGVEELCKQLAHELLRRGERVIVLTNRWPRDLREQEEYEGIPVYRLPFRVPEGSLKAFASYHLTHRMIRGRLLRILHEHRIDVLHVQCVSSNADYALYARNRLHLPLVVTLQGELTMDASRLFERSEAARQTLRRAMAEAEMVTGCSAKTLADVEAFLGRKLGDRAKVIFNGAKLADFERPAPAVQERPYILGIGRLVPQKGFDVLLRAFAKARSGSHDLLIAGDGPDRQPLQDLLQKLELGQAARLVGRADHDRAVALFRGSSFVAVPSRADEGLPVVCAEAMGAGKAVIGSRVGGIPEAVMDGQTGLIVEKEDVDGLAQAIRRLEEDGPLRSRLGATGRERAKLFDWSVIAGQYYDVYRSLINHD